MKIMAVDPGIDETGVAVFEVVEGEGYQTLNEAVGRLHLSMTISTLPSDPLWERLAYLGNRISAAIQTEGVGAVFVEIPSYHGSYTGGIERRKDVNKLFLAIGAILGSAASQCSWVETVPALTTPKKTRHGLLEAAGLEAPTGPRGGLLEDELDAIWLGVEALTSGRHRLRENSEENRGVARG